jgi:ribonucleoside-diphosphate reductase alpha chain
MIYLDLPDPKNFDYKTSFSEYLSKDIYEQCKESLKNTIYYKNFVGSFVEKYIEYKNFYVPNTWSTTASKIIKDKYAVKNNKEINFSETSSHQIFWRLAGTWTYWLNKCGYITEQEFCVNFLVSTIFYLENQVFAPNSPQWFNTGLHWAYGIKGKAQGHYHYDLEKEEIVKSTNAYERPQVHACFIQSLEDNLVRDDGILNLIKKEANLFKFGSGTGTNFSKIRGKGESLSGGGYSSGLMSFLKSIDSSAGAVKSGGTTRRSAKMVILDDNHPDIEEFIDWKVKEEQKVVALNTGGLIAKSFLKELIEKGYSQELCDIYLSKGLTPKFIENMIMLKENNMLDDSFPNLDIDWQGESYASVYGQNSNNSVRLSDEFMKCVEEDGDWNLIERTTGNISKTVKARYLLNKIAKATWLCADPGIQYSGTINKFNTCPNSGEIRASNPCSEYFFLDDTACNLGSLNLMKTVYIRNGCYLPSSNVINILYLILDVSITMAQYPSKEIAQKSWDFRTIGIGYANLGSLFMSLGIPYDSKEALEICKSITEYIQIYSTNYSNHYAILLGSFPEFSKNISQCEYIYNKLSGFDFTSHSDKGFRNAQLTCIAPTGTIGLLMDCDTTGIEPDFALVKHKELAGGGYLEIVNQSVVRGLNSLDYSKEVINRIYDYLIKNRTLKDCIDIKKEHLPVFDCANDISVDGHLNMLATAQKHVNGAISKTINMPNNSTVEDIHKLYIKAYILGIKAVSVYRDCSKLSQPLNDSSKFLKNNSITTISIANSNTNLFTKKKLSSKREGYTKEFKIGGVSFYLTANSFEDGSLAEIFISTKKLGSTLSGLLDCFAVLVSKGLQKGIPLEDYIKAVVGTKFEPNGIVVGNSKVKMASSILDLIFRDLEYTFLQEHKVEELPVIEENKSEYTGSICPSCHESKMIKNGTCELCLICGETTGCS